MKKMSIKIAKFLIAVTMVGTIIFAFGEASNNRVFAAEADTQDITIDSVLGRGTNFIDDGKKATEGKEGISEDELNKAFIPFGKVLVAIATATLFIVAAIMGIQWITATPDKQAQLKKQLVGFVVSIVVIYGAVGIWALVKTIMEQLTK